jgi:hypothetical protein
LRITAPHFPDRLSLDGGTVRFDGADLSFDGVDAEIQDNRGVVSGSIHGYVTPARTFDVAVVRGTIGPRGLEWLENEAGSVPVRACRRRSSSTAPAFAGRCRRPGRSKHRPRHPSGMAHGPSSISCPAPARSTSAGSR